MTATNKEILVLARSYIEKGWTQGSYAKTSKGMAIEHTSTGAAKWCTVGAVERACIDIGITCRGTQCFEVKNSLRANIPEIFGGMLTVFNDDNKRTKQEVLEIFDKAIAAVENTK